VPFASSTGCCVDDEDLGETQASALPPAAQMETYERLMLRGQILSFLVMAGVLGFATYIAYAGALTAAATLVGITAGGGALLTLFARRRAADQRNKR
jgi:hypothetical protein